MKPEEVRRHRLYDEFAHLWTLVSAPADYAKEAGYWRRVLREKLGPGRHEVLELGVGGGNNLSHLTDDFRATAVDISEKMLANSVKLNPSVVHHVGDMRTVRLGKKFRAVLIHDAVSYLLTEDDLRATFATAAAHLEPGGVLVMAPDFTREEFRCHQVRHSTRSREGVTVTHIDYQYDPDPTDTTVETIMFYLICEDGKLRIEHDRHVTGLFPLHRWLELMEECGFRAEKHEYPVHELSGLNYLLVGTLVERAISPEKGVECG